MLHNVQSSSSLTMSCLISTDLISSSHRRRNVICSAELKTSPPMCQAPLRQLSPDSQLCYWVNNCGRSSPNPPGLICKFSIKVRVQAGQQQPEWITKINSLPLMMSTLGMCTAEAQWEGCSTGEPA